MNKSSHSPVVISASRIAWMAGKELIVSDVSLDIYQGQRVAILGPNGAGKSSLLKLLGMMNTPSCGQLTLFDQDLTHTTVKTRRQLRSRIAWIPQGLQVVGQLSAVSNAVLGALGRVNPLTSLIGWFPASEMTKAHQALADVGLDALSGRRTDSLSGGERQKVAIARALVQGGEVVLADEPTASLDPMASRDMMLLLKRLSSDRGLTTVAVLHDVELALSFADRIIGMKHGKIVLDIDTQHVHRDELEALYAHAASTAPNPPDRPRTGFLRRVQ